MTADLSALIARLEAAEEVTHALEIDFAAFLYANGATFAGVVNYDPELWSERNASPLSSLDAALALAERVLPGWAWEIYTAYQIKGFMKYGCNLEEQDTTYAFTPALALVIAILRAKQGEGE